MPSVQMGVGTGSSDDLYRQMREDAIDGGSPGPPPTVNPTPQARTEPWGQGFDPSPSPTPFTPQPDQNYDWSQVSDAMLEVMARGGVTGMGNPAAQAELNRRRGSKTGGESGRWSRDLARAPGWAEGFDATGLAWAKSFADRPGGLDQLYASVNDYRREAEAAGLNPSEDDAGILRDPLFRSWTPGTLKSDPRIATSVPSRLGTTGGTPGVGLPGQIFDDPSTKLLEDLIKSQVGGLMTPVTDPYRGQYEGTLQAQLDALRPQGMMPSVQNYIGQLEDQIRRFSAPVQDEGQTRLKGILDTQLTGLEAPSPDVDALTSFLRAQFENLSKTPGYSPEERALINTQASEPLEALRTQSQKRELARTSQAGYLPTSGLHNERMNESDRFYDQLRSQAYRDLAINEIDRRDADLGRAGVIGRDLVNLPLERQGQVRNVAGLLADLTSSMRREGDTRALQATDLTRARADVDLTQQDRTRAQAGQASGVAGLLAALAQGTRAEEQGRQNQAIQLATVLQRLPIQAQQQAMSVIQGTAPPESLLPAVMAIANQGNAQNQNLYSMLGQLAALFT